KLAMYLPENSDNIVATQLERITDNDRQKEYRFIAPSVSPNKEVRDSLFQALLQAENRRIEPWAATALTHLNNKVWKEGTIDYIRPGLEVMKEVQRTGDIFFPTAWARALLSGHHSVEAKKEVEAFFSDHAHYPTMLGTKIKQQADHLYRIKD
ncbi:MAG: aminopeptidase, partial [Phocaeicola sp.]